jgi:hypothetical protein
LHEKISPNLFRPDFCGYFNDKRLERRGTAIIGVLTHNPNASIRRITSNNAEQRAAYRFLNNKKVTEEVLIKELCSRSARHCTNRHILCIQDTTEMDFFSQRHRIQEATGLGRLDSSLSPSLGFKMHSTMIIDAFSNSIIGFSDVQLWHREADKPKCKDINYKALPIEEKESYKWIKAANNSKELLKNAATVTFIEDREGDIYEQLSSIAVEDNVHYIIRSKTNRNTVEGAKAWDILAQQTAIGTYSITLPTDHRKGRKKEDIELKVRYAKIDVAKGLHIRGRSHPNKVALTIVEAYEDKPKGISWKLLTTHEVNNFENAYQIVEWYSQRWLIEQVHRLLKNKGFQIEESELESGWAIRKLSILMLSALLRIFQMNLAYSEPEGGQPIEEVFTQDEIECLKIINEKIQGNTIKQQNKNNPANLKWATWIIARIGGWKGYDSQGPPGIILLKRGMDKFTSIYYGWNLGRDVYTR